jgi:YVTN family beta-propeller protein
MKYVSYFAACVVSILPAIATLPSIAQAQSTPAYTVTKTVPLGTPDRWDYVVFDSSTQRVYVAHGDRVTVVDGRDGTIRGQIEGFPGGTHGIAISAATHRGYTDDGHAGEAGSFDLQTLKPEKRIKAGADADAVVYDPATGHVFVVNGDPGTLTVIDPKTDSAVATLNLGGKLEYAVAGGDGKLYVNGEENKEIVRVNTKTNQVDARWPIPNCTKPHGLAIDTSSRRLFSSCANSVLVVVNTDTGATVATLPIGLGTDAAAFDPKRKLVFSSNGQDGTLSVIQEKDAQTYVSLGSIKTAPTARTMGLDPDTGRIYLVAADIEAAPTADSAAAHATPSAGSPTQVAHPAAPQTHRMPIVSGSLKLLFLDPTG